MALAVQEVSESCGSFPDFFTLIGHAGRAVRVLKRHPHTHTSYFLSSGVGLMIFESGMHFDFEKAKARPCRHRSPHRAPSSLIPSRYMQEREPRVVKSRRHGMLSSERLASFGRSSACLPAASPSLARSFHWSVAKSNTHNSDCTMQICNMLTARAALTIPCLRSLVAL